MHAGSKGASEPSSGRGEQAVSPGRICSPLGKMKMAVFLYERCNGH